MIRSFSKDQNIAPGTTSTDGGMHEPIKIKSLKRFQTHSRNNSSDLNSDFRHKLTHSRTNSRDDAGALNIRYIQNQLKPQEDEEDDDELTTGCGHFVKKHARNHSYDQIYMPNNIRFDADFFRNHHSNKNKNVNVLKNVMNREENRVKNSNETEAAAVAALAATTVSSRSHSRNNSKDLNIRTAAATTTASNNTNATIPQCVSGAGVGAGGVIGAAHNVAEAALSILRHRRTNSKDLNYTLCINNEHNDLGVSTACSSNESTPAHGSGGSAAAAMHLKHAHGRKVSHHKIQIDDERNELIGSSRDDEDDSNTEEVQNTTSAVSGATNRKDMEALR